MNIYIITGVSRGIGEAIARKLLVHGNTLFCASRTMNEDLVERASSMHVPLFYDEVDLSERKTAEQFMHDVFQRIDPDKVSNIALINNAGMLEPIAPVEKAPANLMEKHLMLNLLAPAILTSLFIAGTKELKIPKVVLNISSGAAKYPYSGWSMYCTSKAGLDMFTRTIGLEQSTQKHPVKIMSLAPGIVDTAMQTQIRHTDINLFPEKDKFLELHSEGRLSTPESVASVIAGSIFNPEIENGVNLTIEQLKEFAKGSS
ncbi:MAG: (S)-benzoin forming benzil reductase [Bacteroidetes bacterium]|nr:(S)-benzoin forming benzil reductase [Bacteroidota bacterium]